VDEHWTGAPAIEGASSREMWVDSSARVSLRVMEWTPDSPSNETPVVFVPGWGSVFEGWKPLIEEWARHRRIVYIETREKGSSRIKGRISKRDFTVDRLNSDIAEVLGSMGIESKEVDWFSSSLGSTLLVDAFQKGILSGRTSILLAPNHDFIFPIWARFLMKIPLPRWMHPRLMRVAIWAVDRKVKEEGQRIRYRRALLSQDLGKMLLSARFLMGYSLPIDLSSISVPCAIMTASSDKLHGMEKVLSIVERIPGALMIEVPSNQYAHEADVLKEIRQFQSSV
jgi:pimeloyl-ACP methyl ester carboxylesterase